MNEQDIINLFQRQKENFGKYLQETYEVPIINGARRGISTIDALIVYALILDNNIQQVVEFGTESGFTTTAIALAMQKQNKKTFVAAELNRGHHEPALLERLQRNGVQDFVILLWGDANKIVPKFIKDNKWSPDFCFIDGEHSKTFAEGYIKNIIPLLKSDAIICIHDLASTTEGKPARNCKGHLNEEWGVVRDWLQKNHFDFTLTHQIFGGQFEKSPKLPVNVELYNKISKIINVDLLSHLNMPPMMAITKRKIHEK